MQGILSTAVLCLAAAPCAPAQESSTRPDRRPELADSLARAGNHAAARRAYEGW